MTLGGYVQVDCSGIDFGVSDPTTVPGIFQKVNTAYKTRKMLIACNCNYNGYRVSPLPVQIVIANNNIIASAEWFQVLITSNDSVTVTNMLSE